MENCRLKGMQPRSVEGDRSQFSSPEQITPMINCAEMRSEVSPQIVPVKQYSLNADPMTCTLNVHISRQSDDVGCTRYWPCECVVIRTPGLAAVQECMTCDRVKCGGSPGILCELASHSLFRSPCSSCFRFNCELLRADVFSGSRFSGDQIRV